MTACPDSGALEPEGAPKKSQASGEPPAAERKGDASGEPAYPEPNAESLLTRKALIDTVVTERSRAAAAEDVRRSIEIDKARLEAELEAERESRQRLEEQVRQLRREIADPTGPATDSNEHIAERRRRELAEAQVLHLRAKAKARKQRVRNELEHLRKSGVPEEDCSRVRIELERLMGESIDTSDTNQSPSAPAPGDEQASALPPESVLGEDEPQLPPGWRYATDLPPERQGKRWRRGPFRSS